MMKDILLVALQGFTDWTPSYLAYSLGMHGKDKYRVCVVGTTMEPIVSMGGLRLLPDCDIRHTPKNFAGIALLGGMGWLRADELLENSIAPLVRDGIERHAPVGGIGFGADALAVLGVLNDVLHTGNSLAEMQSIAQGRYTGANNYRDVAAVRDSNIITAAAAVPGPFARAFNMSLDINQETAGAMYAKRVALSSNPEIIDMDSLRPAE